LPSLNNGSAHIKANEEFHTNEYQFDKKPGNEQFRLVWAAQSVPELEQLRRLVNPTDKGQISKSEDIKAVTEFLQQNATSRLDTNVDSNNEQINVRGRGTVLVTEVELKHR